MQRIGWLAMDNNSRAKPLNKFNVDMCTILGKTLCRLLVHTVIVVMCMLTDKKKTPGDNRTHCF